MLKKAVSGSTLLVNGGDNQGFKKVGSLHDIHHHRCQFACIQVDLRKSPELPELKVLRHLAAWLLVLLKLRKHTRAAHRTTLRTAKCRRAYID